MCSRKTAVSKCQLGKMPQPLLFDEQTHFLDCLCSYPSVRMASCPGRSWPKLLPWALTLSNNRFRWALCVTVHIKCLNLLFYAKHGTEAWKQICPYISFGTSESPKSNIGWKSPYSEVTTTSHTSWYQAQSDYLVREEYCGCCTLCDKMVVAITCEDKC